MSDFIAYNIEMLNFIKNNLKNGVILIEDVRKEYPNDFEFDLKKLIEGGYVVQEGEYLRYIRDSLLGFQVIQE